MPGEYISCILELNDLQNWKVGLRKQGKEITGLLSWKIYAIDRAPANLPEKYQADALIPLEQADQINHVAGKTKKVWITIKIAPNAPAGTYHASIYAENGQRKYENELEITIWKFKMPQDIPITIMANSFVRQESYKKYGIITQDEYNKILKKYLAELREYKINALGNFYPFPVNEILQGKKPDDIINYVKMVRYVVDELHYRFFRLPPFGNAKETGPAAAAWQQGATKYYPAFAGFLQRQQLTQRAIIKAIDEPKTKDYSRVIEVYRLIKSLVPEIKTESAGGAPPPEFIGLIDIWVTYAASYDPHAIQEARDKGQEIWLYANKLHGLDQPLVHQRLIGWYLYRYKFQGYLLWGMDEWSQDPWQPSFRIQSMRRGTFFYPHPRHGYPIPTTRLEALRIGLQDYLYLTQLEQAARQGKVDAGEYQHIMRKVHQFTENLQALSPQVSWTDLEDLRIRMGKLLDAAAGGGKH